MAERQPNRKRRRQQQHQPQRSEAAVQTDSTDGLNPSAARARDASTQTSPPPSPSVSGEDGVDLSLLLLQPQQSFDSTSSWLAWIELSGFTPPEAPATTTTAATGKPAATAAAAASSPSFASSEPPSASSSPSVVSPSALPIGVAATTAAVNGSRSTPMARYYTPAASPVGMFGSMPLATMHGAGGQAGGEGQRAEVVGGFPGAPIYSAAPASTATSTSMLHLRPSSAVVLPLDGFRAPLVDTQRPPLHAPRVNHVNRPAVLPWMNKQPGVSSMYRNHVS